MNNHMEAAVDAVAKEIHSSGWTCDSHEPLGLDKCPSCLHLTTATTKLAITAALPHIRAMIAQEIEVEDSRLHQEYRSGKWDNGYSPEWSAGMGAAAHIAGGQHMENGTGND